MIRTNLLLSLATLLSPALYLQAFSTAYVSVCCNAPSTAGVFSPSTLTQTGTIITGSGGDGMALSPDGARMYVTVDNKRQLQVISTASGAVIATVNLPVGISGTPPLELAISPDGAHVYVFAPQARPNSLLWSVDTATFVATKASLPAVGSLGTLLVSPDGKQLYFEVGYAGEYIQVMDAATLAPVKQVPVNEIPSDLAITPSGLILMTDTNKQLMVIDPSLSTVRVFTLPVASGFPGIVISSPDSSTAYISFAPASILAINITSGATVFNAPIGYSPNHFAISPDGSSLYSTNLSHTQAWSLAEFKINTQKPVKMVPQLGPVSDLALSQDGHSLYVLNADQSAIAAVDVATKKVKGVAVGGVGINSVGIPPGGTTVWASQYAFQQGGDVVFLNPATDQISYKVGYAGALTFHPNGLVAYLASPGAVIDLDIATLTPLARVFPGQLTNISQAIPSPDGTRLYVSVSFVSGSVTNALQSLAPGEIRVFDATTFKCIAAIGVPDGMGAMALTPDGAMLVYTANFGRLHLASTATNKLIATLDLNPANGIFNGLALSADGSTAWVADGVNNLLIEADIPTRTQLKSIPVGKGPSPVVLTPDGSEAWVATLAGLEIVNTKTGHVSGPVGLPGTPSAITFGP